jgi:Ras of Complex, Roc, domain of DAPkinase
MAAYTPAESRLLLDIIRIAACEAPIAHIKTMILERLVDETGSEHAPAKACRERAPARACRESSRGSGEDDVDLVYKVCFIGAANTGKTAAMQSLLASPGERVITGHYVPTIGVEVHPLVHVSTAARIRYNVWDCAGEPKFSGLGDGYYIQSDVAICFHRGAWSEESARMADQYKTVTGDDAHHVFVADDGIDIPDAAPGKKFEAVVILSPLANREVSVGSLFDLVRSSCRATN